MGLWELSSPFEGFCKAFWNGLTQPSLPLKKSKRCLSMLAASSRM